MFSLHTLRSLILILCISILGLMDAQATHIMGGEVTYEFVGFSGGQAQYDITFNVYVDAAPPSNFPTGALNSINFGVYNKANNTVIVDSVISNNFITANQVTPSLPPSCPPSAVPSLSAFLNTTTVRVRLPINTEGYFVMYEVCCRNGAILNINNVNDAGNTFYTEIPSALTPNSSPQFADAAIPAMCTGDTTTFVNSAVDPDGDRLIYSFVTAYDGASPGNPQPFPPSTYNPPPASINWATTYGLSTPFGAGGYAQINPSTGVASYYTPNAGQYVVTIEIKEYRNFPGVGDSLIGRTRRELQIVVDANCPPNPPPNDGIVNQPGGPGTPGEGVTPVPGNPNVYNITAGQAVSFEVAVSDPGGDSVFIESEGNILDGTNGYMGPLATMPDTIAKDSVSSRFYWLTDCDVQGAFQVFANTGDRGCPPKVNNQVFLINVTPFRAANILGRDTICDTTATYQYHTSEELGSLQWSVTGGILLGNDTADTIRIKWHDPNAGSIQMIQSSGLGCIDTNNRDIAIFPKPPIQAGPDTTICQGDSVQLNVQNLGAGSIAWSPSSSLLNPNTSSPIAFPSQTTQYVATYSELGGCVLRDTLTITVVGSASDLAGTSDTICPGSSQVIGKDTSLSAFFFNWSPGNLLNDSTIQRPTLANPGTLTDSSQTFVLEAAYIAGPDTCYSYDTVVHWLPPQYSVDLGPDTTVCSNSSLNLRAQSADSLVEHLWLNLAGDTLSQDTTLAFSASNPGPGRLDSTLIFQGKNTFGCIASDTSVIGVWPLPNKAGFLGNDTARCVLDSLSIPIPNTSPLDSFYTEVLAPLPPDLSFQLSDTFSATPRLYFSGLSNSTDSVELHIKTTITDTSTGCQRSDTLRITLFNLPRINLVANDSICSGDSLQLALSSSPRLGSLNWSWSPATGLDNPNSNTPVFTAPTNMSDTITPYTFIVTATNTQTGCQSMDTLNVDVFPDVNADAGNDPSLCSGDTIQLGTAAQPNFTYSWAPSTHLDDPSLAQPQFTHSVAPGQPADTLQYILTATLNGCIDQDTVEVITFPRPPAANIRGTTPVCPFVQNIQYLSDTTSSDFIYTWTVNGGTLVSGQNAEAITVDWGQANTNAYVTLQIIDNQTGCLAAAIDTFPVYVNLNLQPQISGPTSPVCLNEVDSLLYHIVNPNPTSSYQWFTSPHGGFSSKTTGDSVWIVWDSAGTGQVWVEETSTTSDGLNTYNCAGFSDTLSIPLYPFPNQALGIQGQQIICINSGDTLQNYQVINPNTSNKFIWSLSGGGSILNPSDSTAEVSLEWDSLGAHSLQVQEVNPNGCFGQEYSIDISVYKAPQTPVILGPDTVCNTSLVQKYYEVLPSGMPTMAYEWSVEGGLVQEYLNDSTAVLVTWIADSSAHSLSVQAISSFSCRSALSTRSISIDRLSIDLPYLSITEEQEDVVELGFDLNRNLNDTARVFYSRLDTSQQVLKRSVGFYPQTPFTRYDTLDSGPPTEVLSYRMGAINACGDTVYSELRDLLILDAKSNDQEDISILQWNSYSDYLDIGYSNFDILRALDTSTSLEWYQNVDKPSEALSLDNGKDGFKHCYRIRVRDEPTDRYVFSNSQCIPFTHPLSFPNVITPNGDGFNDKWVVQNLQLYQEAQLRIYNRWGQEVYEAKPYTNDFRGMDLPAGTYFYYFELPGTMEPQRGFIEIIR